MISGIDHLVIACSDPDAAAAELTSSLGIAVTGGGSHAGRGSFNRIAWLADGSYLELIGVTDADLARRSPVGAAAVRVLEEHGGGLATYALREDDIETASAALGAIGAFGGVLVNLAFRQSYLTSKSGDGAVMAFIAFYAVCCLVTWAVFLRRHGPPRGRLAHLGGLADTEDKGPVGQTAPVHGRLERRQWPGHPVQRPEVHRERMERPPVDGHDATGLAQLDRVGSLLGVHVPG